MYSRPTRELRRPSATSAAFHSRERSLAHAVVAAEVPPGSMISLWASPGMRRKSCVLPVCTSTILLRDTYAAEATAFPPPARDMERTLKNMMLITPSVAVLACRPWSARIAGAWLQSLEQRHTQSLRTEIIGEDLTRRESHIRCVRLDIGLLRKYGQPPVHRLGDCDECASRGSRAGGSEARASSRSSPLRRALLSAVTT